MADTRIINLPYNSTPTLSDVFPVVSLGTGATTQVSLSSAMVAANIPALSASNYIYVTVTNSATANGANLLNAYTTAKTLTPSGSALSTSNRVSLILPPATYDLNSSSLRLDTEFIDIVGLTKDPNHVIITSNVVYDTIHQFVNDIRASGFSAYNTSGFGVGGWAIESNYPQTYIENAIFGALYGNNLSGTFNNCIIQNNSIGICSGTFNNCVCLNGFIGNGGTMSGVFNNCSGSTTDGNSVGGIAYPYSTLSGTFNNCFGSIKNGFLGGGIAGASCTLTGTFNNCIGTCDSVYGGGGIAGAYCTLSGVFINCSGSTSNDQFSGGFAGGSSTINSLFINCIGSGLGSVAGNFGGWSNSVSGKFINCSSSGDGYFFGSYSTLYAQFINCNISDTTLPILSNSGDSTKPACYINCLDGSGRLVNGSA